MSGSRCIDMPLPTKFDRTLGEISDEAFNITNTLSTMERVHVDHLQRYRSRLRGMLADFNTMVMTAARQ